MTTGYVYVFSFFLFLFLLLPFFDMFYLTPNQQKKIVKCNDQTGHTFPTGSRSYSSRATRWKICSDYNTTTTLSTDAANLVWHHIEFCAHSFFSFFVALSLHSRASIPRDVEALLNIVCPCVAAQLNYKYKSRQID